MTLIEALASLSVFSVLMLTLSRGSSTVLPVWQKLETKTEAQQLLWMTAECLTDECSDILWESRDENDTLWFYSGKNKCWFYLAADMEHGLCFVYDENDEKCLSEERYPLLPDSFTGGNYYTAFESCSCEDSCITITNLAVYEKSKYHTESISPLAILPELKMQALNLNSSEDIFENRSVQK